MKSLTKTHLSERDKIIDRINEAQTELEEKLDEYTEVTSRLQDGIGDALVAYNETLAEARQFIDNIAGEAESVMEDRSEKWQESDAGKAYQEWIDEWRGAVIDDVEIDFPSIEGSDLDAVSILEDLPTEP